MKQKNHILYYIILSALSAFLILVITFFSSSNVNTIEIHDKLLVGAVFITSCIFGITLVKYPGWLRRKTGHRYHDSVKKQTQKITVKYKGHHPDCGRFCSHTVITKNKTYCAGCLGLAIGSTISIILVIIYISITLRQNLNLFYFLMFLGFIIIVFTYVEIMLPIRYAIIHVASNIFFVIGFLLITIGIIETTGNKIYGMISILLSFLWLDSRIQLSNWQHTKICQSCNKNCKIY